MLYSTLSLTRTLLFLQFPQLLEATAVAFGGIIFSPIVSAVLCLSEDRVVVWSEREEENQRCWHPGIYILIQFVGELRDRTWGLPSKLYDLQLVRHSVRAKAKVVFLYPFNMSLCRRFISPWSVHLSLGSYMQTADHNSQCGKIHHSKVSRP